MYCYAPVGSNWPVRCRIVFQKPLFLLEVTVVGNCIWSWTANPRIPCVLFRWTLVGSNWPVLIRMQPTFSIRVHTSYLLRTFWPEPVFKLEHFVGYNLKATGILVLKQKSQVTASKAPDRLHLQVHVWRFPCSYFSLLVMLYYCLTLAIARKGHHSHDFLSPWINDEMVGNRHLINKYFNGQERRNFRCLHDIFYQL